MQPKIAKRRWLRIMPVVFITYSLAYLDRANIGFGSAGGMAADLHITNSQQSLISALFFLGYFFFQVPGMFIAGKYSLKKLIFWSLILWGLFAMATGLINNVYLLACVRFLLGVVEGAVLPGMVLLLSRWFTKAERSRANTFLILGNPVTILWMSVLSGYLVHTAGWRRMFVYEAAPALIWAFFWYWLIDDSPGKASWLAAGEKLSLEAVLQNEQQNIPPVKNFFAACRLRIVVLLCLQYALWGIGVNGFVIWLPSIIKAAPRVSIVQTGWLAAIPYILAVAGMIILSWLSDKTQKRKLFVWPALLAGALAFYGSYVSGVNNFWLSFILLCVAGMAMYAPYGPFFAMITESLPSNVVSPAIALINSVGSLGAFTGIYVAGYLNDATHGFTASYVFMAVSLLVAAILTIAAVKKNPQANLT
ncbi:MAG TPA: MFS transporter [Chitinophagaceae bacterium]|nr:MFS transporter [Chitinophagaceae bacterium]